jgi:hypothetical protein
MIRILSWGACTQHAVTQHLAPVPDTRSARDRRRTRRAAAFSERFEALRGEVTAMAFSGDGGLLAVALKNRAVKVLSYPGMKPLAEFE